MFNNYSIIWIIRIFLQIRIRIRIFLHESQIFGFGFENFLTTNKIRIRIRKFSDFRIIFGFGFGQKKRFDHLWSTMAERPKVRWSTLCCWYIYPLPRRVSREAALSLSSVQSPVPCNVIITAPELSPRTGVWCWRPTSTKTWPSARVAAARWWPDT